MTDHTILAGTAEQLRKKLEHERDEGWHTGTEYNRLVYRIERLEMFEQYVRLDRDFNMAAIET